MKSALFLLPLLVVLALPPARALTPPKSEESGYSITIFACVITDRDIVDRSNKIPDRWGFDIDGDADIDITLFSIGGDLPGSELAREGTWVEAEIKLTNLENHEYELVRWIRFGRNP